MTLDILAFLIVFILFSVIMGSLHLWYTVSESKPVRRAISQSRRK